MNNLEYTKNEILKLAKELTEEEKRKKEEKKIKRKERLLGYANTTLGIKSATLGKKLLDKVNDTGDLDGRIKLYHATKKENIPSILENGLKGSKTNNDSFTRKFMEAQGINGEQWKPFENKTYLSKNKEMTKGVIANRANQDIVNREDMFNTDIINDPAKFRTKTKKAYSEELKKYKTLKARIPKEEYKKLKIVPNPELLGAKNVDEFIEKKPMLGLMGKPYAEAVFKALKDDSVAIDGDFSSKYFKGGKGYVKNSPKEILNHARKNPKAFKKALGKATLGTGAIALGGYSTIKGVKKFINAKNTARKKWKKKKNKEKTALEIVIEAFNK